MKKIFPFLLLYLTACTSALKKQCEETNWFEHGKSIALQGKRLNEDSFVNQCAKEKVSANSAQLDLGFKAGMSQYCLPETVYQTGRKGEFFNPDLCDPSTVNMLRTKHNSGVTAFCTETGGTELGSSGKVYNQICPAELEKTFLPAYRKARKSYLTSTILGKEEEIIQLQRTNLNQVSERNNLQYQLMQINNRLATRRQVYDPFTRTYKEEVDSNESASTNSEKSNIEWKLNAVSNSIEENQAQQQKMREEITKLKAERDSI